VAERVRLRRRRRDNRLIQRRPVPPSPAPTAGRRAGGWVQRSLEWILPSENPTGVIYGAIVIGALLAAESGLHETYPEAVGSMAIAACTYWLADAYAAVLGRRLATNAPLTPRALSRALASNWAVVRGATIPLLVILVCWVLGAHQPAAVNAALWSVVASLVGFELLAGIRSRARPGELAVEVGVGVAMGIGVIALKVLLHH
jgi:hypothetical protein